MANLFKEALRKLGRDSIGSKRIQVRQATFRLMYERFREILALNDSTLELIADIEDLLGRGRQFSLGAFAPRIRKAAMNVFVMVKNLNQIAPGRHQSLYEALQKLDDLIEIEVDPIKKLGYGDLVTSLTEVRGADAALAGSKMANLGEIAAECGFAVPDGFVITTGAFLNFMTEGQLWEKCEKLDESLEFNDWKGLTDACHEVRAAVLAADMPADLADAVHRAYQKRFSSGETMVAMRSSATGEDTTVSSHAGLYTTILNVDSSQLLEAYRKVLASTFSPAAVTYRFQRGITINDSLMAVGCIRMIQPRTAGIVYSRIPDNPEADAVMISATLKTSASLAAEGENTETRIVTAAAISEVTGFCLNEDEVAELYKAARRLESHFGAPQDIEWAFDRNGVLVIFQSRPMTAAPFRGEAPKIMGDGRAPLLEGGLAACPGAGSGDVKIVDTDYNFGEFPEGSILVARHSSPDFAQIMNRCSAIVTDVGSPTGHMSSLAREFRIPTIVGLQGATRFLKNGQRVTVDAWNCRVFEGYIDFEAPPPNAVQSADSPALDRLRRLALLVTPLTMTDPASPEFRPQNCRSLHDITRYVHEKAFEVMFHYGDAAAVDSSSAMRLEAKLPIIVELFDVGGGIANPSARVRPEQIVSIPMQAFLKGLLDPGIRWDLPRPVSMRGFLSVLGESMAGPPAYSSEIGRVSYAIISDRYMNFSTKAGYHFSTVDTYCGQSVNKNYIHFRFLGGAADEERRRRRIWFLSSVIEALDFKAQIRGDTLVARLDKYSSEDIQSRLVSLGRLTLCARQLDMLMDSNTSPDLFARAFLAGEWQKF
jgi:pyruvate,water dikinase